MNNDGGNKKRPLMRPRKLPGKFSVAEVVSIRAAVARIVARREAVRKATPAAVVAIVPAPQTHANANEREEATVAPISAVTVMEGHAPASEATSGIDTSTRDPRAIEGCPSTVKAPIDPRRRE